MLAPEDEMELAEQTGRTLRGVVAVAARCPVGHPCVVTCYPLRREAGRVVPFPTLYWLTCPRLSRLISHLERDGVIAELQTELDADAALRAALARDHAAYIAQRRATLTEADRRLLSEQGLAESFDAKGIGGMANFASIKCLHLHVAHHLAAGNAIGALVLQRYGIQLCPASPL